MLLPLEAVRGDCLNFNSTANVIELHAVCLNVFICCLILLRDWQATLNIHSDGTAEEHYLMLPELGRVLQALRGILPGGCVP